jgi:hypothetical protein
MDSLFGMYSTAGVLVGLVYHYCAVHLFEKRQACITQTIKEWEERVKNCPHCKLSTLPAANNQQQQPGTSTMEGPRCSSPETGVARCPQECPRNRFHQQDSSMEYSDNESYALLPESGFGRSPNVQTASPSCSTPIRPIIRVNNQTPGTSCLRPTNTSQHCANRPGKITKNGFLNFVRDKRAESCSRNQAEIIKNAAEEWQNLSGEEKQRYTEMGRRVRRNNRSRSYGR